MVAQAGNMSAPKSSSTRSTTLLCDHCDKVFSRAENLIRHQAAYQGIHKFICDCGRRFSRSDLLRRHRKIHERKPTGASKSHPDSLTCSTPVVNIFDDGHRRNVGESPSAEWQLASTYLADPLVLGGAECSTYMKTLPPFEGLFNTDLGWDLQLGDTHSSNDAYHGFDQSQMPTIDIWSSLGSDTDPENATPEEMASLKDSMAHVVEPVPSRYNTSNIPIHAQLSHGTGKILEIERREFYRQNSNLLALSDTVIDMQQTAEILRLLDSANATESHKNVSQMQNFPDLETAQYFLHLFLLEAHPRYPIIHLPTFSAKTAPPLLLLCMTLLGSTYSRANRGKYGLAFFQKARDALGAARGLSTSFMSSEDNIFALLLLCTLAVWSGENDIYECSESDRASLVLACRKQRLFDCRFQVRPASDTMQLWHDWISVERRRRLGLSIYIFDSQMAALLNNLPHVAKAEMEHAALPCADIYWEASTAQEWKTLLGSLNSPPSTYYLTTLAAILQDNKAAELHHFPELNEFNRTLFIYCVHTYIYDWRQTTRMVDPNGAMRSVRALGPHSMVAALQDSREWLQGALGNWHSLYGSRVDDFLFDVQEEANFGGELVYYLGALSTRVSFADLHQVTGFSGLEDDALLAREALHNWLQTDDANASIELTLNMLSVAYRIISDGKTAKCSLELAVSLYMGGLIIWSCHWLRRPDIAATSGSADDVQSRTDTTVGLDQVALAAQALKSLWHCRVGLLFGDILDRLSKEGK